MRKYKKLNKRVTKLLKPNNTLYMVNSVIKEVEPIYILQKPYWSHWRYFDDGAWFCLIENNGYDQTFSLEDYNIIPNKYNEHRIFTKRQDAEEYAKLLLSQSFELRGIVTGRSSDPQTSNSPKSIRNRK